MAHKIKNILLWVVLVGYMVAILGFVSERNHAVVCEKMKIVISNADVNHFLKSKDIELVLANNRINPLGVPLEKINTSKIEKLILKNPAVIRAAAYTNLQGELVINVEQCRPILRVINDNMQQYFLDEKGRLIPYHSQFCAYTLVANGNINEPFPVNTSRNIYYSKRDSALKPNVIYDLHKIAKYIDGDDFWRAQIEQVFVNGKGEFELVPRMGAHTILFGRVNNMEYKFKKLKSIYYTFNQIGWNDYKTINLKFKEQVICTKR